MKRNKTIDIAKGIGIIAVVWGHLTQGCPIKVEIYLFHMPLFFILSGYFFNDGNNTLPKVLKKRVQSYLIPYAVFFAINLSLFMLLYISTGHSSQIFISPGILIYPYGVVAPLWFLLCLFEVHILYYFICRFIRKEYAQITSVLICFSIGYILSSNNIQLPLFVGSSLSMLLFFQVGNLMKKHAVVTDKMGRRQTAIAVAGVLCYVIGIIYQKQIDIKYNMLGDNVILFLCAAIGGSYVIIYSSKYLASTPIISAILSFLGRNTLIIFSLHLLCFEIAQCLFPIAALKELPYINGIYLTVFGIIGSLLLGYPIKRYILPRLKLTNNN